jgi:cellulose synthase/poly-beta-1,6-N-acetylglucosamine synthase-like glycosyltransferase
LSVLAIVYGLTAVLLAIYGLNSLIMVLLYLRHRPFGRPVLSLVEGLRTPCENQPPSPLTNAPPVTVQLPIYNELHVVERLIDAVARLDYPRDRLQIQVLDDSTDETTTLTQARVDYYRTKGIDIVLIHRPERTGFKAGALQRGLETATGGFVAIFDADFVPNPDFLRRIIPHFQGRPRLGLVQARWSHINADYSPLTRAQALALDGHFVVEQTARQRSGLFMNFNGASGVWRKRCIEEAGGWQGDTLSEDLDLSYRAQLAGWEFLYLPDVASPAEIPPQINAFKRQQFRWAKGSIQCLLKHWRALVRVRRPAFVRLQGLIHLSNYLIHPLMLILLLLTLPLLLGQGRMGLPLFYLGLGSVGPPLVFILSQWDVYPDWHRRLAYFPLLALLGTGIALNNALAVGEALVRRPNLFQRTPKFGLEGRTDRWAESPYALPVNWMTLGEVLLSLYSLITVIVALAQGNYYAVPFLLLYLGGFGYVAVLGLRRPHQIRVRGNESPRLNNKAPSGLNISP